MPPTLYESSQDVTLTVNMCRLGDDNDQGLTSDDRSYVVTGPGSGFHISQVN